MWGVPLSPPRSYWRFEDTTAWGVDSSPQGNNLTTTAATTCHPGTCFSIESKSGIVGSYLQVDGSSPATVLSAAAGAWECGGEGCSGSTVEFLIRAGRYFNLQGETSLMTSNVNGQPHVTHYEVRVGRHSLGFHTGSDPAFPDQDIAGWDVLAKLEGVGVASPARLFDGEWHHLAFVQNGLKTTNCSVAVWLDGERPSDVDYRGQVWWASNGSAMSLRRATCALMITENITFLPNSFDGDVDEFAIFDTALSDATIYAHSQDALTHHRPYTLGVTPSAPAPAPVPSTGAFGIEEFAIGTVLPTPPHSVTSGVNASCLEQLEAFPAPRYPPHPTPRALAPLSNCMDPRYMAGENQKNVTKEQMEDGAIAIQRELALKWNYALFIGNVDVVAFDHHAAWYTKVFALVNSLPEGEDLATRLRL